MGAMIEHYLRSMIFESRSHYFGYRVCYFLIFHVDEHLLKFVCVGGPLCNGGSFNIMHLMVGR